MPELVVLLEQLFAPVPGGTGRYSRELAAALAATAPSGWTVAGAIARHTDPTPAVIPGVAGPELVVGPGRLPLPRRALIAAWDAGIPLWPGGKGGGRGAADAVLAPTPLAPPRAPPGRSLVVTVHDAVPWTHPEGLTRRGVRWHRRVIARAARQADALVVPTEAVAAELTRHVTCRAPVRVVGAGASAPSGAEAPSPRGGEAVAARLRLPPRYVLAVGTLEPRKGIDTLIAAMAQPSAPDLPVVLAGQPGWGRVDPAGLARGAGLAPDRVRVLGRISDAELAVVLRRATVLVAPSLAEGFGLPVLEAMAAGVPVVHSDAPALVEVSGGAGVCFPRGDPVALAAAVRGVVHAVVSDPAVAEAMISAGRCRAARFSWDQTARRVWGVYLGLHGALAAGHRSSTS